MAREAIPGKMIDDLCTAAGVKITRCARILVSPSAATFTVYDEDENGELIVDGEGDYKYARTHIITVPIHYP